MMELNACRKTFPNHYIRLTAFDSTRGIESIAMSFIVNRPAQRAGLRAVRQEVDGRTMRYTVHSYATDKPEGAALRTERCALTRRADEPAPPLLASPATMTAARRLPARQRRCRDAAPPATHRQRGAGAEPGRGGARRARPRPGRPGAGQGAHPRHRGAAGDRQAARASWAWQRRRRRCTCASPATPAPARPRWRCAWPRSCTAWATCARAIWWR